MGFLEQKQGQGTFVRGTDAIRKSPLAVAMENQDASLTDLLEVRMGLETNAAALAAVRADEKDIHFLEKSLQELEEQVRQGELGNEADVSFHMAITYATKNPVQIYLMKTFFDFLFIGIKENLRYLYEEPANIDQIFEQHFAIVQAIKNRNPEEASAAMRNHINFVMAFFRQFQHEE
jgi:GntR family transcriptional repressor for pyruvate dehydrogenase complex